MTKTCTCCNLEKVLAEFVKDKYTVSGYKSHCKACVREKSKAYDTKNRKERGLKHKKWASKNRDHLNEYRKFSEGKPNAYKPKEIAVKRTKEEARLSAKINKQKYDKKNKEILTHRRHKYYSNPENVIKRRTRTRNWINSNPSAKIAQSLRHRLNMAIREQSTSKRDSASVFLGCSLEEFLKHLESLWLPGMSWENYGAWVHGEEPKWNIDHIYPCSKFDLTKIENQKVCFHYSNMRPLWGNDNYAKNNKTIDCPWGYDFQI